MSELSFASSMSEQSLPDEQMVGEAVYPLDTAPLGTKTRNEMLLERLMLLQQCQTPIVFAHYLHGISEYLATVIVKKEKKLRNKVLNNASVVSETTSLASFRLFRDNFQSGFTNPENNINYRFTQWNKQFPQNHYEKEDQSYIRDTSRIFNRNLVQRQWNQQFSQENNKLEGISSNNVKLQQINRNASQRFTNSIPHSSLFEKSSYKSMTLRRKQTLQTNNNTNALLKFSEIEDTFPLGTRDSSLNLSQNTSAIKHISTNGEANTFMPSFNNKEAKLDLVKDNPSSKEITSQRGTTSFHSFSNQSHEQFNCVRVGPLGRKFQLPIIWENEPVVQENEEQNLEENGETQSVRNIPENRKSLTSPTKTNRNTIANNVADNDITTVNETVQYKSTMKMEVLKDWTILLINKKLHLQGTKIVNKSLEKNHLTGPVESRSIDGTVKTENGRFILKGSFLPNENMPENIKLTYASCGKFPRQWRKLLSDWINNVESHKVIKVKECKVLLHRINGDLISTKANQLHQQLSISKGRSKNSKSLEQSTMDSITSQSKKKEIKYSEKTATRNKEQSNKSLKDKEKRFNVKKSNENAISEKNINISNSKKNVNESKKEVKTKKINQSSSNNDSTKTDKKRKREEEINENENRKAKTRRNDKSSKEVHLKEKKKTQSQKLNGAEECPKKKSNTDLFGECTTNVTLGSQALCTPSAFLRSLKKNSAETAARYTPPPFQIMFLNKKNEEKPKISAKSHFVSSAADNPIAKRMAKLKGVKKNKKQKQNKNLKETEVNTSIQNLITALSNKTPQTTPVMVRKVFRSDDDDESRGELDLDFGSDISSIAC